jgi:peptide/nickel transport system substrate-binding protein
MALGPDGWPAQFLVFMPLVAWNRRGELEGRLAESWEHSPDFRTWTVRLRDGVRWHDGVAVTAHDLKFTLDLLQNPETLLAMSNYAVKVLDDRTCSIAYDRQGVFDEGVLDDSFCCWPKHLLERLDPKQINTWDFWKHPVGCGPYRHVGAAPATMMEFEASSDYVFGKPKIERVILKFGARDDSVPELLSGNVDAVCRPRRSDISNISRDRRFLVHETWPGSGHAIYWNVRHPFLQDAAVRRALTYAINRRELLQVLNLPADARPIDFLPPRWQARRGDFTALNPYDPDRARRLLDQAGWRWSRRALRERGGKALLFKALCGRQPESLPSAVYVQDQLKRAGIRMDIVTVSDYGAILSRFGSGEFAAMFGTVYDGDLEMDLRRIGYDNPSFFGLLDKARSVFDPEEKERVHGELTRIFSADTPLTFLSPLTSTTIADRRIRGLEGSPYRGDLTQCMGELWLEDQV